MFSHPKRFPADPLCSPLPVTSPLSHTSLSPLSASANRICSSFCFSSLPHKLHFLLFSPERTQREIYNYIDLNSHEPRYLCNTLKQEQAADKLIIILSVCRFVGAYGSSLFKAKKLASRVAAGQNRPALFVFSFRFVVI